MDMVILCGVCMNSKGKKAYYYGANVKICDACRAFFKNYTLERREDPCICVAAATTDITATSASTSATASTTSENCNSCRYAKCLECGMKKSKLRCIIPENPTSLADLNLTDFVKNFINVSCNYNIMDDYNYTDNRFSVHCKVCETSFKINLITPELKRLEQHILRESKNDEGHLEIAEELSLVVNDATNDATKRRRKLPKRRSHEHDAESDELSESEETIWWHPHQTVQQPEYILCY